MNVPFLDLKAQYKIISEEVKTAINSVLENTAFILGKPVEEFEHKFAEMHNVKHCIGLSSGTDGNHSVLWALGIQSGDEVILPANTFIATAWGATLNGATPVFADCDGDSYNISASGVEAAVSERTKAVVAVHLYGQPADIDALRKVTVKYGLKLVEDCAQAHNAEYKGRKIGGLAEAASFSFYPGKNLGAYGEAGCATTSDPVIAQKIRMIRDHGSLEKYNHQMYGHNYRMESIQGAILNVKIKYLNAWTERRRQIAEKYCRMLEDIEEIKLPVEMNYAKHVYHLFVICLKESKAGTRDKLVAYLNKNGISTGLHYPVPLHMQTCFEHLGYKKGQFPKSEYLAENCISLPIYPELLDEQVEYVCSMLRKYFTDSVKQQRRDLSAIG